MELLTKLENTIAGWGKNIPHLPPAGQRWLAQNIWWIALIGAILSGIGLLFAIGGLFTLIALLGAVSTVYTYYAVPSVTAWSVVSAVVGLVFLIISGLLLALAVKPLKELQKKGWVLLLAAWLVNAVSIIITSVLSLSIIGFIMGVIFGVIGLAISGYFLFEMRGQFGHSVKEAKTAKKA